MGFLRARVEGINVLSWRSSLSFVMCFTNSSGSTLISSVVEIFFYIIYAYLILIKSYM